MCCTGLNLCPRLWEYRKIELISDNVETRETDVSDEDIAKIEHACRFDSRSPHALLSGSLFSDETYLRRFPSDHSMFGWHTSQGLFDWVQGPKPSRSFQKLAQENLR
jgi:hypothetical protein